MPIFMDRHDIPGVTATDVAEAHQKDLMIQHRYNCKALTYWYDEEQGMAFCLMEAPHQDAVQKLHKDAHGLVPNQILEVERKVVQSFLGRIKDPVDQKISGPAANHAAALRSLMLVHLHEAFQISSKVNGQDCLPSPNGFITNLQNELTKFGGSEVEQSGDVFMASFASLKQSVLCALSVQKMYSSRHTSLSQDKYHLKIGVSAGVPVTDDADFFGRTIKLAEFLAFIARPGTTVLSASVAKHYRKPNNGMPGTGDKMIFALTEQEEDFIFRLMQLMEAKACDLDFDVLKFGSSMGMSKSRLYRRMIATTGYSPNDFIREYRLRKALIMIRQKQGNISEVSYLCGFNSPSYFSKCFLKRFHTSPSNYSGGMLS